MGLFSGIMSKIFGHTPAVPPSTTVTTPSAPAPVPPMTTASAAKPPALAATPASVPATPAPAPVVVVDVTAVLDDLAAHNKERLDWRRSIVDLMKLVGIDSGLSARKELAAELHYPGDMSDSAKMNVWLHKEVIKKLAANGGRVPADLLD